MKPFSESCEQNKDVILDVIKPLLASRKSLLEVGSGTGQHAVYFAQAIPHIEWHTSDRSESINGIQMWLDEYRAAGHALNVHSPVVLDVAQTAWPELNVDAIFTANTIHIMHWDEVETLFVRAPELLDSGGVMMIYGPFNYNGKYTSASNERFDGWLKSRDSKSGIKDFSDIDKLATENGLQFLTDYEMPANNRILCWQKK